MEASELRQFGIDELKTRVKQWREELFRAQIRKMSNEMKDTSVFKKLRRDIARGLMVMGEKTREQKAVPQDKPVSDKKAKTKAEGAKQ